MTYLIDELQNAFLGMISSFEFIGNSTFSNFDVLLKQNTPICLQFSGIVMHSIDESANAYFSILTSYELGQNSIVLMFLQSLKQYA